MSCIIPANPDIAGVGVRVSVYIQAALVLIPATLKMVEDVAIEGAHDKQAAAISSLTGVKQDSFSGLFPYHRTAVEWDDVAELMNPNLALGYALIISGILQARTFGLSVYHAITILHLNWIISLSIIPCFILSKNDKRKGKNGSYHRKGRYYMGQLVLTAAFGLWLFTHIDTFDKAVGNCTSSTLYYVPGKPVNVTNPIFRRFWLIVYSITVVPFVNYLLFFVIFLLILIIGVIIQMFPAVLLYIFAAFSPKLRRFLDSSLTLIMGLLGAVFPQILLLVITERTISINTVGGEEDQWTFGQSTALLIALSSVRTVMRQVQKTMANVRQLQVGVIRIELPDTSTDAQICISPSRARPLKSARVIVGLGKR